MIKRMGCLVDARRGSLPKTRVGLELTISTLIANIWVAPKIRQAFLVPQSALHMRGCRKIPNGAHNFENNPIAPHKAQQLNREVGLCSRADAPDCCNQNSRLRV